MLVEDSDADDPDPMLVLEVSDAPCDDEEEAFVKWDFNQNRVTVADENPEYDADQPFVTVAFTPALNQRAAGWDSRDLAYARERLESESIKTYKYPLERLDVTGRQF